MGFYVNVLQQWEFCGYFNVRYMQNYKVMTSLWYLMEKQNGGDLTEY